MPVLFQEKITREDIRANPERLYVFDDNLARRGYGGLAAECRGEANTIGIATKRTPSMDGRAFFRDADYDRWVQATRAGWDRIEGALRDGKTVVFPTAGLGTGLAQLSERAPRIALAIENLMRVLLRIEPVSSRSKRHRSR